MKKQLLLLISFVLTGMAVTAQKMPVSYDFGEKYRDRYRYSNLVAMDEDDSGGYILVRAYYQGLILKPKGYLIEIVLLLSFYDPTLMLSFLFIIPSPDPLRTPLEPPKGGPGGAKSD